MRPTNRATRPLLGLLLLLAVGCGGGGTTASDAAPTYSVGGTVAGLVGSGLVLQNDGRDDVAVSADGTFTFATPMGLGVPYYVTVSKQPTGPAQTCKVVGASGTLAGDVTNVAVTCTTDAFAVGGTVTGLAGAGLVLRNNGGDDLTVVANGAFVFATPVPSGQAYEATVEQQPSSPTQKCTVTSGSGNVGDGPVTTIAIACATDSFTIGGTVTGLAGTGLVLQDNGGDDLAISADGAFTFATPVTSGAAYTVTVLAQPTSPAQKCTVAGGAGTVGGDDVTSITVNCTTSGYTIGGAVSGLVGTGLVLQDNGGDDLTVSGSGTFAFATPVPSGGAFAVTVLTQPSSPTQTCVVTSGSGTVVAANVSTVVVNCTTDTFTVSGTVTGLTGTGLVLQNNLGDNLPISADGTFTFATAVKSGSTYGVTVLDQPTGPAQTCTVTQASGLVTTADITNVQVTCATKAYVVGGTVLGLTGSGLVLQNNGGDDLTISANGTFAFATSVVSGAAYSVTVTTQPSSPTQTCQVLGGSGTVVSADVASVVVNCAIDEFSVGGTVSGLSGTGLGLLLNGTITLPVSANGTFAFPTTLPSGDAYEVTVATQPTGPWQTCVVTNGSGSVVDAAITDVEVTCTTNSYTVGGTVTGLSGTGLVLQNNAGDDLEVSADGTFTFVASVASGQPYSVTVATQPSDPTQTCTVGTGAGLVGGLDVTSVTVTCVTNTYLVSGSVTGLTGTTVLQNNGGDALVVTANGGFSFATKVPSGGGYAVTVTTNPTSPWQTCIVTNGTGTVASSDVTDVLVTCTTNAYTVGGTVTGLVGTGLKLQNNAGDDLTIGGDGSFTFATGVKSGLTFNVTVLAQPASPTQTCTVSGGNGTVGGANVTSVTVNCSTNAYTVGGTVSGLGGTGLVLRDNGGDDLVISGNGSFAFAHPIASGAGYAVTVGTNPTAPWQTCNVGNGTGTVAGANVTSVTVTCTTNSYAIGGTVVGLAGSGLVLRNNAVDPLTISANGVFTFATPLASGATYAVTVATQPTSPWQTCAVANGTDTVGGGAVTTVVVTCTTNRYTVGGTVAGLAGTTGLVLQNNGGNDITMTTNSAFTFSTSVPSGTPYAVIVKTQPTSPWQTCTVTNGSGTMAGANVANVTVTCVTNTYTIGGTLVMQGGTAVLRNNGGNDLTLTATGNFTFTTAITSGGTYAVTVASAPAGQTCVVVNGSGTVTGANVTNVVVSCAVTTTNATVRDVAGVWNPATLVPCGNGTNTNCTQAVAEASCTAIGRKLVSHASNGTAGVISLGATTSCYWSISYFTNTSATIAGQCLIGVSNASWNNCCTLGQWHGNIVTIPATLSQQYGYVSTNDSGYSASLSNVSGTVWGCQTSATPPPARAGCTTYYVACE